MTDSRDVLIRRARAYIDFLNREYANVRPLELPHTEEADLVSQPGRVRFAAHLKYLLGQTIADDTLPEFERWMMLGEVRGGLLAIGNPIAVIEGIAMPEAELG